MKEELIIAGFGGQGVLSTGKILAYSGVMQDYEVSWLPSYGPEMRGGTANVTVIISDKPISSPTLQTFDTAIILNQQSMDKFESQVKPGGVLIYDTNGITRHPQRKDIKIYVIDATEEAAKRGNSRIVLLYKFIFIALFDLNGFSHPLIPVRRNVFHFDIERRFILIDVMSFPFGTHCFRRVTDGYIRL